MSPGNRAPSSRTTASTPSGASSRVRGRPVRCCTRPGWRGSGAAAARPPATRSFTVVFPTDPVIPTTRSGSRLPGVGPERPQRGGGVVHRHGRPADGLPGRQVGGGAGAAGGVHEVVAVRAATTGTNSCPGATVRESIDAPSTSTSGPRSSPPTTSASRDAASLTGGPAGRDLRGTGVGPHRWRRVGGVCSSGLIVVRITAPVRLHSAAPGAGRRLRAGDVRTILQATTHRACVPHGHRAVGPTVRPGSNSTKLAGERSGSEGLRARTGDRPRPPAHAGTGVCSQWWHVPGRDRVVRRRNGLPTGRRTRLPVGEVVSRAHRTGPGRRDRRHGDGTHRTGRGHSGHRGGRVDRDTGGRTRPEQDAPDLGERRPR